MLARFISINYHDIKKIDRRHLNLIMKILTSFEFPKLKLISTLFS